MKAETLFASIFLSLLTCLPVALAAPIRVDPDYKPPRGFKVLDEPPRPGHSGVHYDKNKNEVVAHYGEKDMVKHMEHLMYNKRKNPTNDKAFDAVPAGNKENRKKALDGTKPLKGFARDEKPPNSAKHDGKVTMRFLPKDESDREMKLLSTTTKKARGSDKPQMRYEANPGPNYHGRGDRSISRQTAPGVKTNTNTKPPWNAGPGKRAESTGPYRKGDAPEPVTTEKEARRGRPTTPRPIPGPSKPKDDKPVKGKSPSRSPSPHGGGDKGKGKSKETRGEPAKEKAKEKSPSRSPSSPHGEPPKDKSASRNPSPAKTDTKSKGKEPAKPKPAWNAGPGASAQGTRKSERVAAQPKPKPATTETKPKAQASKPKVGKK